MKITSIKEIQKANELRKFMDLRLFAEKKETELKKHFKDLMGNNQILYIGNAFVIMLEPRERTGLNIEALRHELGDKIHDFETFSTYTVFSIRENKEISFKTAETLEDVLDTKPKKSKDKKEAVKKRGDDIFRIARRADLKKQKGV